MSFKNYEPMKCPPPINRKSRVLIAAVQVPFVSGGAESHIESLRRELTAREYDVDVVRLPFKWYPPRQIINDAIAWRLIDLTNSYGLPVDLAIVTRFPSYCIRHPRKVAWVLHQHRQAYDFLNSDYTDFKDTPDDDEVRKLLYEMDSRSLKECRRIYTNSKNVSKRMKTYLDIDSQYLYHPPPLEGKYYTKEYGEYVFTAGRLEVNKRVDLLLQSIACSKTSVKAVIAGKGPCKASLQQMAHDLKIEDAIEFVGYLSEEQLLEHYARCGAVWYAPLDEDYGYVTLEAFLSAKPVITTTDSGGVLEFVTDGDTGFIGEPDAESMAIQLDRWVEQKHKAPDMGIRGRQKAEILSWDRVIDELTGVLREDIQEALKENGTEE